MLGNKIDVEENKRVVSLGVPEWCRPFVNEDTDIIKTGHDFLPVQGWDSILRDQCKGGYQRRASIRGYAFPSFQFESHNIDIIQLSQEMPLPKKNLRSSAAISRTLSTSTLRTTEMGVHARRKLEKSARYFLL